MVSRHLYQLDFSKEKYLKLCIYKVQIKLSNNALSFVD